MQSSENNTNTGGAVRMSRNQTERANEGAIFVGRALSTCPDSPAFIGRYGFQLDIPVQCGRKEGTYDANVAQSFNSSRSG
jgi:hypothetical protein